MGILDSIKSKASGAAQSGLVVQALTNLMTQSGGIQGLVQNFQQHGLGNVMQSWIGKGENLPINADQLKSVIGQEQLGQISQNVGAQPDDLLQKLTQVLPQAVNHLTPDGEVKPEKFTTANLLDMGKNLFGHH